jgi:hypothetical protein
VTGPQDDELPWGSDAAEDVIEQGREEPGRGWPERFRWRPRGPKMIGALAVAALVVGLLGGYLAGDAHGHRQGTTARPSPSSLAANSYGLAETGDQCSTVLGHTLQLGVEVVNGSPVGIQLGQVTARFPRGGLKLTRASWGPCGTLPFVHPAESSILASGASTWLMVTVTTQVTCPQGLSVEYVASYNQQGETYTVILPGFADLGGEPVTGCHST